MTITRNFKLCLNAGVGLAPYINVNQFDQGEQWVFTLYNEDGTQYSPSTGAIVGIKADHFGIINTGTVVDGKVVINETQQMTAAAGKAIFELQIDGDTHGTANFIVMVEPKPGNNADYSDSDISGIQQAIDAATLINELADAGEEPKQFIIDEVDAWLDNHPEATTTVQDGAITAPKINNSLWDKILVNEEASGAVASFDDGADDVPVSSLKVALEPIQTGTGDPSPDNVRPIYPANDGNGFSPYATNTSNGFVLGSYLTNTGGTTENATWRISEYIPVPSSHTMYLNNVIGSSPSYCFYDANKQFISGAKYSSVSSITISTPATAKYIRVSVTNDNLNTFQLTGGYYVSVQRAGKNLLNYNDLTQSAIGAGIAVNADGTIYDSSPTADSRSWNYASCNWQMTLPAGTYTFTIECTTPNPESVAQCRGFKSDGTSLFTNIGSDIFKTGGTATRTFTFTEPTTFGITVKQYSVVYRVQIETGETSTEFEPYIGTSYPYSLGQTVYGGTVDLATGVLTVTHFLYEYDGTETFNKSGTALNGFYNQLTTSTPHSWPKMINYSGVSLTNERSNMYVPTRDGNTYKNNYGYVYLDTGHNFNCDPDVFGTTVDSFKAKLAELYANGTPVSVFCRIAEPQTIQLTPQEVKTLLGYNNISSSGTVDVIYHADTKLYVDKMTAVDNAIIAPTEEGFTATRNYTVNDLVIVADTLYKVTANIASGSAITPNSNVTQTTLSALIKALS